MAGEKIMIARQDTLEAVQQDTQGVLDKIGNPGDTGGSTTTGTVMGKLNALLAAGCVKSVQRQTFTFKESTTLSISEIDPNKTLVFLTGFIRSGTAQAFAAYVDTVASTSITIKAHKVDSTPCHIEIIEFY